MLLVGSAVASSSHLPNLPHFAADSANRRRCAELVLFFFLAPPFLTVSRSAAFAAAFRKRPVELPCNGH